MTRADQDRDTRARLIRAIEARRARYPHGQIADLYWQIRQVTTRILRRELREARLDNPVSKE